MKINIESVKPMLTFLYLEGDSRACDQTILMKLKYGVKSFSIIILFQMVLSFEILEAKIQLTL